MNIKIKVKSDDASKFAAEQVAKSFKCELTFGTEVNGLVETDAEGNGIELIKMIDLLHKSRSTDVDESKRYAEERAQLDAMLPFYTLDIKGMHYSCHNTFKDLAKNLKFADFSAEFCNPYDCRLHIRTQDIDKLTLLLEKDNQLSKYESMIVKEQQ